MVVTETTSLHPRQVLALSFLERVLSDKPYQTVENKPEAQQNALGLLNMKERAELIEAQYQLESRTESPNRGTLIQLILPLPKNQFDIDDEDLI